MKIIELLTKIARQDTDMPIRIVYKGDIYKWTEKGYCRVDCDQVYLGTNIYCDEPEWLNTEVEIIEEPEIRKIDYIMFEHEKWEKLKREKGIVQEFIKYIIMKENELVDRINEIERRKDESKL